MGAKKGVLGLFFCGEYGVLLICCYVDFDCADNCDSPYRFNALHNGLSPFSAGF